MTQFNREAIKRSIYTLRGLLRMVLIAALMLPFSAVAKIDNQTLVDSDTAVKQIADVPVVRILFYFMPATLAALDNDMDRLVNAIETQVGQANYVFANSNIPGQFEIADIRALDAVPGWSDPAHQWADLTARQIYENMRPLAGKLWQQGAFHDSGADAMFVVDYRDAEDQSCGWATINTEDSLRNNAINSSYGMFRLGRGCGVAAHVLPHEIGHLLGAAHAIDSTLAASSHLGYGVRCAGKATLMHPSFPKHPFVSSPALMKGGEACGYQDAADNTQLFTQRMPLLAAKVSTAVSRGSNNANSGNSLNTFNQPLQSAEGDTSGGGSIHATLLLLILYLSVVSGVRRCSLPFRSTER